MPRYISSSIAGSICNQSLCIATKLIVYPALELFQIPYGALNE